MIAFHGAFHSEWRRKLSEDALPNATQGSPRTGDLLSRKDEYGRAKNSLVAPSTPLDSSLTEPCLTKYSWENLDRNVLELMDRILRTPFELEEEEEKEEEGSIGAIVPSGESLSKDKDGHVAILMEEYNHVSDYIESEDMMVVLVSHFSEFLAEEEECEEAEHVAPSTQQEEQLTESSNGVEETVPLSAEKGDGGESERRREMAIRDPTMAKYVRKAVETLALQDHAQLLSTEAGGRSRGVAVGGGGDEAPLDMPVYTDNLTRLADKVAKQLTVEELFDHSSLSQHIKSSEEELDITRQRLDSESLEVSEHNADYREPAHPLRLHSNSGESFKADIVKTIVGYESLQDDESNDIFFEVGPEAEVTRTRTWERRYGKGNANASKEDRSAVPTALKGRKAPVGLQERSSLEYCRESDRLLEL